MKNIEKCCLFDEFAKDQLQKVSSLAREVSFKKDQKIVESDRENFALWILTEGDARVRQSVPDGLEVEIYKLKPNEFFGFFGTRRREFIK